MVINDSVRLNKRLDLSSPNSAFKSLLYTIQNLLILETIEILLFRNCDA
jgi:hypothetical protein